MPYKIQAKEVEAVSALPAAKRYEHFIKRVADWEEVWGLWSDGGWAMMSDGQGGKWIPVWPHPAYAEAMAVTWSGNKPKMISLEEFMEKWLPGMMRDGLNVAVFPVLRDG